MNFVAGAAFHSFASVARRSEPFAEIVRVEAPSLWRRANVFELGEPSAHAETVRVEALSPCECVLSSANPLRRLHVSKRSRCGAVRICPTRGEPVAEILRIEALSLWRRANSSCSRQTLCGDPARRSALAVAPFDFSEAVFGSCLVVCAFAFAIACCLGFHLPGPR